MDDFSISILNRHCLGVRLRTSSGVFVIIRNRPVDMNFFFLLPGKLISTVEVTINSLDKRDVFMDRNCVMFFS